MVDLFILFVCPFRVTWHKVCTGNNFFAISVTQRPDGFYVWSLKLSRSAFLQPAIESS